MEVFFLWPRLQLIISLVPQLAYLMKEMSKLSLILSWGHLVSNYQTLHYFSSVLKTEKQMYQNLFDKLNCYFTY